MTLTPLATVLFDLDDTRSLFDHVGTARAALAAAAVGWPARPGVPPEALCQRYSELLEEMHPRVLRRGEVPYLAARAPRFQRLLAPYEGGLSGAESQRVTGQHDGPYLLLLR